MVDLTASYIDDALGNLLRAVRLLVEGDAEARASWLEEPGEYRWVLRRHGDQVRVRILEFPGWSKPPDRKGAVLLDVRCDLCRLVAAVAAGARRALEEHGEAGYRKLWVYGEFPTEDLQALEAALGEPGCVSELPRICRHGHRAVKHPEGWWDAACQGYLHGGPCRSGHYWILEVDECGNEVPPEDNDLCPACRALQERL
jgi:hypothetical protein